MASCIHLRGLACADAIKLCPACLAEERAEVERVARARAEANAVTPGYVSPAYATDMASELRQLRTELAAERARADRAEADAAAMRAAILYFVDADSPSGPDCEWNGRATPCDYEANPLPRPWCSTCTLRDATKSTAGAELLATVERLRRQRDQYRRRAFALVRQCRAFRRVLGLEMGTAEAAEQRAAKAEQRSRTIERATLDYLEAAAEGLATGARLDRLLALIRGDGAAERKRGG